MKRSAAILILGMTILPVQAQEKGEVPRVESVVPASRQPHAGNPAVIWYDSFDGPESTQQQYYEYQSGTPGGKRTGSSRRCARWNSWSCRDA